MDSQKMLVAFLVDVIEQTSVVGQQRIAEDGDKLESQTTDLGVVFDLLNKTKHYRDVQTLFNYLCLYKVLNSKRRVEAVLEFCLLVVDRLCFYLAVDANHVANDEFQRKLYLSLRRFCASNKDKER